jgi:hypothetical protein
MKIDTINLPHVSAFSAIFSIYYYYEVLFLTLKYVTVLTIVGITSLITLGGEKSQPWVPVLGTSSYEAAKLERWGRLI